MEGTLRLSLKVDRAALVRAGQAAVALIVERTQRGIGADGRALRPYSTRPLALPLGAIPKRTLVRLRRSQDGIYVFTSRRGTVWALVEGGYAAYKALRYPRSGTAVNLTATGAMLQGLGVVRVDERAATVRLGFSRAELAERAAYNQRTRRFLGLTPDERGLVARIAGEGLSVTVS